MKNNILVDLTASDFSRENPDSMDFYAARLIKGFKEYTNFNVTALVRKGTEEYVDYLVGFFVDKIIVDISFKLTFEQQLKSILGLFPSKSLKKELLRRSIDVILSPYHFRCRFFFSKPFRQYAIVHDLIPYYIHRESMGKLHYLAWRIYHKLLTRKVTNYISISEETHRELRRLEGVDSVVIHNSIPFDLSVNEQPVDNVKGKRYILDVNRFVRYKNAETLIRSFNQIREMIPHLLYLKGNKQHKEDYEYLKRLVLELNLTDRVILDDSFRSEEEMRYLYRHADLYVSPSFKEGFGWGPIEAAILETPVLISNIDVHLEVSCNKLPTFNPHSTIELADKMCDILKNPPDKGTREKLAEFYLNKYSLKNQIEKMIEAFKK